MLHKASSLTFLDNTTLKLLFMDGKEKRYDVSSLFEKYPQMTALKDRNLFLSGRLISPYGIIWNDNLDLEAETVYEEGETISDSPALEQIASSAVAKARAQKGLSQKQLASLSGIDQSDISKIERGLANPSVSTLNRIAKAVGGNLTIHIDFTDVSI